MTRTRIKICSICRPEDARLAADAGADAIGLILHPASKRYVPPDAARAIVRALPAFVTPVGVFVDAPPAHIRDVAATIGLRHIQLHGHEPESVIAELSDFTLLKAVKVERPTFRDQLAHWTDIAARHPHLHGLVLETGGTTAPGGTGVENDWALIADTLASTPSAPPIIAAGGLRPDNVADVVRLLRPYAVDISSGVEESLRIKSPQKVTAFITAVRSVTER